LSPFQFIIRLSLSTVSLYPQLRSLPIDSFCGDRGLHQIIQYTITGEKHSSF